MFAYLLSTNEIISPLEIKSIVKKSPISKLSRSKALKMQEICHYRHARKTSGLVLLYDTDIDFISHNNFVNSGFFKKVFTPVSL